METRFLKEALFNGRSTNAVKLGTILTLGRFWVRLFGSQNLYRGLGMESIDFTNILALAEISDTQVAPPAWIEHNPSTSYFYVVRQTNLCGDEEHSLGGAVKVS